MDVPVWIFARFREGTLEPYVHYVPLADDCGDLEAKMDYYIAHPDEAEAIVAMPTRTWHSFSTRVANG